jgi:hypothetical protein
MDWEVGWRVPRACCVVFNNNMYSGEATIQVVPIRGTSAVITGSDQEVFT